MAQGMLDRFNQGNAMLLDTFMGFMLLRERISYAVLARRECPSECVDCSYCQHEVHSPQAASDRLPPWK